MSYRATESLVKEEIRNILYRDVLESWNKNNRKTKVSLTLSNTSFELEKKLRDSGVVICVEKDKNVYKKALKNKPSGIILKNEDLFEIHNNYTYDFVWMDLCSAYSEKILQKVVEFINNTQFNDYSTFAVTFSKRRGNIKFSNLVEYYPKFKEKGVLNYLGNFFKNEVLETKRIDYSCFDIARKAMPMSLFIFKLGEKC